VANPAQLDRGVRLALQSALGKRGASVLVLPGDVLADTTGVPVVPSALVAGRPPAVWTTIEPMTGISTPPPTPWTARNAMRLAAFRVVS
jgi:thiamine pyrophosphate-dependent acetolactate synthase large subunit-like protein